MISFSSFLAALFTNPVLLVITVLVAGAIFINGATDASNAIATAIGTRSIKPGVAIAMGAICNFVGLILMTYLSTAVADTIGKMVNFGSNTEAALLALAAAMISIIVWGGVAWRFGIPTSQSHSLIAGLTGAAIAVQGGLAGINFNEWAKVIYGLAVSTILGFGLGWFFTKAIERRCYNMHYSTARKVFRVGNIAAAIFLALMHGAQDGQKFMSIAMLGVALALGINDIGSEYPVWIMAFCARAMAIGSGVGGKKIIKSVSMNMVSLERYQGFAASFAASMCLLGATLFGIPVSTTHTNTTAIMGTGAAKNIRHVQWDIAGNMVLTWVCTFPGCGLIGFVLAKFFVWVNKHIFELMEVSEQVSMVAAYI